MPLYEYRCHKCGKTIERIQKFSDQPLTVHEECGGELEKLISRSALQFKGSGWYVTDYGKGGVVPKNPESSNGDSKSHDSKSDTKTESKSSDSKTADSGSKSSESKSTESKAPSESTSKPATVSSSSDSK